MTLVDAVPMVLLARQTYSPKSSLVTLFRNRNHVSSLLTSSTRGSRLDTCTCLFCRVQVTSAGGSADT